MAETTQKTKTVVQCDFDGTITTEDVGFMMLDEFADQSWRNYLKLYSEGKIPVGEFSDKAFSMIKADKQTLLDFIEHKVKIRPGFKQMLAYCQRHSIKFVIVSNGLDFYVEAILRQLSASGVEFFAAQTSFRPEGLDVRYILRDGRQVQDGFKDTYTQQFVAQGYRVVYVGNGSSDLSPARLAHHIFAVDNLLKTCQRLNLDCFPFEDFEDVVHGLERLNGSNIKQVSA